MGAGAARPRGGRAPGGARCLSRGLARFSRGLTRFSRGLARFSRGLARFSRGLTRSGCVQGARLEPVVMSALERKPTGRGAAPGEELAGEAGEERARLQKLAAQNKIGGEVRKAVFMVRSSPAAAAGRAENLAARCKVWMNVGELRQTPLWGR